MSFRGRSGRFRPPKRPSWTLFLWVVAGVVGVIVLTGVIEKAL